MNDTTTAKNALFRKANKARKRVMIARDVLLQLASHTFRPTKGTYVYAEFRTPKKGTEQVCDVLSSMTRCEVCGIGALFLGAIGVADNYTLADAGGDSENYALVPGSIRIREYLEQWFSVETIKNVEVAFELWGWSEEGSAGAFARDVSGSTERLRLIMENIVANKGEFRYDRAPVLLNGQWTTPGFRRKGFRKPKGE